MTTMLLEKHVSPYRSTHYLKDDAMADATLLPSQVAKDLVQLFKLLSDETRLRIVLILKQREELNVQTLCKMLGQSQPAVSHHLALLRVAGFIEMRREGKHNFYRIMPSRFEELVEVLSTFSSGTEKSEPEYEDYELGLTGTDE